MNQKELFKLGKKYQKWLEETKINANAYKLNGHSYYFTIYEGKFNTKVKGHAIISTLLSVPIILKMQVQKGHRLIIQYG